MTREINSGSIIVTKGDDDYDRKRIKWITNYFNKRKKVIIKLLNLNAVQKDEIARLNYENKMLKELLTPFNLATHHQHFKNNC